MTDFVRDGTFDDNSRIAIVGVGYWGKNLLRNLVGMLGLERVVVVDGSMAMLRRAYEAYPGIETMQTLDEALLDPQVAGVIVATQASTHRDVAVKALEAGCHVCIEKPLASSSAEAIDIVETAKRMERIVLVGHTFLFSPRVELLAKLIKDDRAIGDIHYLSMNRLNLGLFRPDANVMWDLGPHDLSIILHLLDESPDRIQVAARDLLNDGRPDIAFVNMWFPSGVIAQMNLSWMSPRKERLAMFVGTNGMVNFDDSDAEEPIKVFDKGVDHIEKTDAAPAQINYRFGDTLVPAVGTQEPLGRQIQTFMDSMQSGKTPLSGGEFGIEIVRCLEAADRSWELGGQPVEVGTATPLSSRAAHAAAAEATRMAEEKDEPATHSG